MNPDTHGVKHAWNYLDRDFVACAFWRAAAVDAQPGVGLLPDRRSGTDSSDRCSSVGNRPDLELCDAEPKVRSLHR